MDSLVRNDVWVVFMIELSLRVKSEVLGVLKELELFEIFLEAILNSQVFILFTNFLLNRINNLRREVSKTRSRNLFYGTFD